MPVICRHFGVCGGCQTQDVPYPEQLSRKRRWLDDLLRKAVGRRAPHVEPVTAMPVDATGTPSHFRHKAAFVFGPADAQGRGLVMGHYALKSRRVVPVDECPVHSRRANRLAFALGDHLARAHIRAAGPRLDGILRHVVVRTTSDDREALVLLVVTRNDKSLRKPLRAFLGLCGSARRAVRDDPRSRRPLPRRRHGASDRRPRPDQGARAGPDVPHLADGVLSDQSSCGGGARGCRGRRGQRAWRRFSCAVLDLYAGSGLSPCRWQSPATP